jgi:hypothetical protein
MSRVIRALSTPRFVPSRKGETSLETQSGAHEARASDIFTKAHTCS